MADTLIRILQEKASTQAESTAYIYLGPDGKEHARLSYRELDRRARRVAGTLQAITAPGQRVLLLYPPGIDYIAGFLGCLYHGSIAVPAYSPSFERQRLRLHHILADCQPRVALTVGEWKPEIQQQFDEDNRSEGLICIATDHESHRHEEYANPDISGSTLAMLQYTSGSTQSPRGVMVTHENLITNLRLIKQAFQLSEQSVIVSWLPPFHDMGLIGGMLQPLYLGARCVLMSPMSFLRNPVQWLQAISDYRATTSGGPDFAYQLCNKTVDPARHPTLDLSSWKVAFNGSEKVRQSTLQEFSEKFAPSGFQSTSFFPCYGLAESTLLVSAKRSEEPAVVHLDRLEMGQNRVRFSEPGGESLPVVGSGAPMEGRIEIVDPVSCALCPAETVGEVWISGESVAQGYWNKSEDTHNLFRACVSGESGQPFLRSGDLGFIHDGNLYITGRLKDLIIVRGRNHYPDDIEDTVRSFRPGLGASAVFSLDVNGQESVALIQEVDRKPLDLDPEQLLTEIRAEVAKCHDLQLCTALLTRRGTIPRTTSGKVQRGLCGQLLAARQITYIFAKEWHLADLTVPDPTAWDVASGNPSATRLPQDVREDLRAYLQRLLDSGMDDIDLSAPLVSLGLDSLGMASLVQYISHRYNVFIEVTDLYDGSRLDELVAKIIEPATPASSPRILLGETFTQNANSAVSNDQARIWFAAQSKMPNEAFNLQAYYRVSGALDVPRLLTCIEAVVQRHDSLRSTFHSQGGVPIRIVSESTACEYRVLDRSETGYTDEEIRDTIVQERDKPFDLESGPLLRIAILKTSQSTYDLVFTVHHLVCDAWSLGIFCRELGVLYKHQPAGSTATLEIPRKFGDFILFQEQNIGSEDAHDYWRRELAAAPPLSLPLEQDRDLRYSPRDEHHFQIAQESIERLRNVARHNGTTLFIVLLAAFKTLISIWCEQEDIVVGVPVRGRPEPSFENTIGFFAHPIFVRSEVSVRSSFRKLLAKVHRGFSRSVRNQNVAFSEMVESLSSRSTDPLIPALQIAFSIVPHAATQMELSDLSICPMGFRAGGVDSDLFLTLIEGSLDFEGSLLFDARLFSSKTITEVVASFRLVIQQIATDPDIAIDQIQLTPGLAEHATTRAASRSALHVASSFPAQPLKAPLVKWFEELELRTAIEFAPQEQIFQQLLDHQSMLRLNQGGLNLLLFRPCDLIERDSSGSADDHSARFVAAVKAAASSSVTPYLLCVCPDPGEDGTSATGWASTVGAELCSHPGVHLLSGTEVAAMFAIEQIHDDRARELAGIPYSDIYFGSIAAGIVRKFCELLHVFQTKVIVLDCDNTLWEGICGEDGPLGIQLTPGNLSLQEFLLTKHREGMLLCLCSKNHPADVDAVFAAHRSMPLKPEHFVARRINWRHKSENIRELAEELDLGLASFVFFDDDAKECSEIRAVLPEVVAIQVPKSSEITSFLKHIWPLDTVWKATVDRSRFHQEEKARESFKNEVPTLKDFIAGLDLNVEIREIDAVDVPRVVDLMVRTNQFTINKDRRTQTDLLHLLHSGRLKGRTTRVRDRFGDYGLVGVVLYFEERQSLQVTTFLLSCRALGRGVEHQVLADIGVIATTGGYSYVDISFVRSGQNEPAFNFLDGLRRECIEREAGSAGERFRFSAWDLREVRYDPSSPSEQVSPSSPKRTARPISRSAVRRQDFVGKIASTLRTAAGIADFIQLPKHTRGQTNTTYVAPRTEMEAKLSAYIEELLSIDRIGVEDDFFDLGGDSLTGIRLLTRVGEELGVGLMLFTLFESPTVATLAAKIEEEIGATPSALPPIRRADRSVPMPLSFVQHRLWSIDQLRPGNLAYTNHVAMTLHGRLDHSAFMAALHQIFDRHEILRTRFPVRDEQPVQVVERTPGTSIAEIDLSRLPENESKDATEQLVAEIKGRPFDLAAAPPVRAAVIRQTDDICTFLLSIHHILFDAWSIEILMRELTLLYAARVRNQPDPLPPLALQYGDYSVWQRQELRGDVLEAHLRYWAQQLKDAPVLELPMQKPRPALPSYEGGRQVFLISPSEATELRQFSRDEDVTLFMTMLSAWQILLARYSGQQKFVLGTPVAGRTRLELEPLIGVFVQTLALPTNVGGDPIFRDVLQRARQTVLDSLQHQDAPFDAVVSRVQPERSLSHTPIFQVMIGLTDRSGRRFELPGINTQIAWAERKTALFDLSLFIADNGDSIQATLEYDTDLFDSEFIGRMGERYLVILNEAMKTPTRRISELSILTDTDHRLLGAVNDDLLPDRPNSIVELFDAQAEVTPDAEAVVAGKERISFKQLNHRANQVSHYLRRLGVGPEDPVGVCLQRSGDLVVALLGILKAGACYVPLDPCYPLERIDLVLQNAGARAVISNDRSLGMRLTHSIPTASFTEPDQFSVESTTNLDLPHPDNLAYIIYTSGSTGVPKGVCIEHRNAAAFLTWSVSVFSRDTLAGTLASTSVCFDLSVFEIFAPLIAGRTVVLVESALDLVQLDHGKEVTLLNTIPSVAAQLVRAAKIPVSVRTVALAGEALSSDLVHLLYECDQVETVYNLYGPTETTTYSTCALLEPGDERSPGIGKPISNTQIYIADRDLNLMPCDIPGEIYIGGSGVTRCYRGRPDLTAAQFVPDPFSGRSGGRLYRTGDRGQYRADGSLEYLGRIDRQIKLRGFRIELAEVEANLLRQSLVGEAAAIVRDDPPRGKKLQVYVSPAGQQPLDVKALLECLRSRVPNYMIPDDIMVLPCLPRTTSGKIDYKALPMPAGRESADSVPAARTLTEASLSSIWAEVLGLQSVSIYDNFFQIGGDSILGIQIASRARQAGINLMPRDLFLRQTIAEIASHLEVDIPLGTPNVPALSGPIPPTPIQAWFFEQTFVDRNHWNQYVLLDIRSDIPIEAVNQSLVAVVAQHPSLTSHFVFESGSYRQHSSPVGKILPPEQVHLPVSSVSEAVELLRKCNGELQASLDLELGPLYRAAVFTTDASHRYLFMAAHHLVVDVVSWHILLQDLNSACRQIVAGSPIEVVPENISYPQWASRLAHYAGSRELASQLGYWSRNLAGGQDFPIDGEGGSNDIASEAQYLLSLSIAETDQLLSICKKCKASMEEMLLAALLNALQLWFPAERLTLDLEGHGREEIGAGEHPSRTVGWFTAIYPVTFELLGASGMMEMIRLVKLEMRRVPDGGLGYGVLRYLAPTTPGTTALSGIATSPLLFNYLGHLSRQTSGDHPLSLSPLSLGAAKSKRNQRTHLIEAGARISGGQLRLTLDYSRNFHSADTISELGDSLRNSLQSVLAQEFEEYSNAWIGLDFPNAGLDDAGVSEILTSFRDAGGREAEDIYPLSSMQEGILFQCALNPGSDLYVMQVSCRLRGELDVDLFRSAWDTLLRHYDVLRASFHSDGAGRMFHVVERQVLSSIEELDWRGESEGSEQTLLEALLAANRQKGFSLSVPSLMSLTLAHVEDNVHEFVWTYHHGILDGWSASLLLNKVLHLYALFTREDTPQNQAPRPFSDYVSWLRRQDSKNVEDFWRDRLAGWPPARKLAIDHGSLAPAGNKGPSGIVELLTPQETHDSLIRFARSCRLTVHTVLQCTWAILLSHYGHHQDVVFGSVSSGRPVELSGVDEMAGLFINTLPVYVRIDSQQTIETLLNELQEDQATLRHVEQVSLHQIQQWAGRSTDESLFDAIFSVNNFPSAISPSGANFLEVDHVRVTDWNSYALSGAVSVREETKLTVKYDTSRYETSDIEVYSRIYLDILAEIVGENNTHVGDVLRNVDRKAQDYRSASDLLYATTAAAILGRVAPR
jgi:amino acid adenylation domain-containing protein/FkbH-like protein/non-ribosomal peptide synthase protein (TIGR01720 family)